MFDPTTALTTVLPLVLGADANNTTNDVTSTRASATALCSESPSTPLNECFSADMSSAAYGSLVRFARQFFIKDAGSVPSSAVFETQFPLAGTLLSTLAVLTWIALMRGYFVSRREMGQLLRLRGVDDAMDGARRPLNPTTALFGAVFFWWRLGIFLLILVPSTSEPSLLPRDFVPNYYSRTFFESSEPLFVNAYRLTAYSSLSDGTVSLIRYLPLAPPSSSQVSVDASNRGDSGCCLAGRVVNLTSTPSAGQPLNRSSAGPDGYGNYAYYFSLNSLRATSVSLSAWAVACNLLHVAVEVALILWWRRFSTGSELERKLEYMRGFSSGGVLALLDFVAIQTSPPAKQTILFANQSRLPAALSWIVFLSLEGWSFSVSMMSIFNPYFDNPYLMLPMLSLSMEMMRYIVLSLRPLNGASRSGGGGGGAGAEDELAERFTVYDRYLDLLDGEREELLLRERYSATTTTHAEHGDGANDLPSSASAVPSEISRRGGNRVTSSIGPDSSAATTASADAKRADPRLAKIRSLQDLHLEFETRPLWEVAVPFALLVVSAWIWTILWRFAPIQTLTPMTAMAPFIACTLLCGLLFIRNDLILQTGESGLSLILRRRTALGATFVVDLTASVIRDAVALEFNPSSDPSASCWSSVDLVVDHRLVYSMPLLRRSTEDVDAATQQRRHQEVLARLVRAVRDSRRDIYKTRKRQSLTSIRDEPPFAAAVAAESSAKLTASVQPSAAHLDGYDDDDEHAAATTAAASASAPLGRGRSRSEHERQRRIQLAQPDDPALAFAALCAARLTRGGAHATDLLHLAAATDKATRELPETLLAHESSAMMSSAGLGTTTDFLFDLPPNAGSRRALVYAVILLVKFSLSLAINFDAAGAASLCMPQLESLARVLELLLVLFLVQLWWTQRCRLEPALFALLQRVTAIVSLTSTTYSFASAMNMPSMFTAQSTAITAFVFVLLSSLLLLLMPLNS